MQPFFSEKVDQKEEHTCFQKKRARKKTLKG